MILSPPAQYHVMRFETGFEEFRKQAAQPAIPSGNGTLDRLLRGGFRRRNVYLLVGPRALTSDILLKTAVNAQIILADTPTDLPKVKVALIDANNRFNPYEVSKYAASKGLSPTIALENIFISRVFTWDQMSEVLENHLHKIVNPQMIMVSGLTRLFQYERKFYEELWKAINGLTRAMEDKNPFILMTAPMNKHSDYKPEGGKILTHFAQVLVSIRETERDITYSLVQHPSLPEESIKKRKPPKRSKFHPQPKNWTLDEWI